MAIKMPRIGDLLHRGLIYSLVGISVWAVVMTGVVHRDTLQRGQEALAVKEAQERLSKESEEVKKESELAEAAQAALQGRKF
ncbi:hypothetical protein C8Q75DRAFT_774704 [Abortiporus biennis]|nr:hypothetical protein C8Q75DRAFT_774704 [Abortiporus biennis]